MKLGTNNQAGQMLTQEELDSLDPKQRAIYDAARPADKIWFEKSLRSSGPLGASWKPKTTKPTSIMRSIGLAGTIISTLVLVNFVLKFGGYRDAADWAWTILAASSVSIFSFMWMLGAIESRLIDINETLKARG